MLGGSGLFKSDAKVLAAGLLIHFSIAWHFF